MPSPVGHLLAGAAVYLAATPHARRSHVVLVVVLLGSIAPDFDFLPGILLGDMRTFHHGITHSLAFALLFGSLMLLVARHRVGDGAARVWLLAALAYGVHVLLDYVAVNEGTRGVPLLWPLSSEQLGFSLRLFGHFQYGDISDGIWSVVRWDNVWPLICEVVVLGTLLMIVWRRAQIGQVVERMKIGGGGSR
jgi:membrane-bound metal-dependent hydrolase YbcI (DUF457 family)